MKHVLLPTLLAVALAGCASDPVQLESDTTYRVEWVDAQPLADGSHITITLGSDGRAYGSAGCNHWFASYSRDGDKLNATAARTPTARSPPWEAPDRTSSPPSRTPTRSS